MPPVKGVIVGTKTNVHCLVNVLLPNLFIKSRWKQLTRKKHISASVPPPFKTRFGGHKGTFKHEKRNKETTLTLSKYIWELIGENIPYTLSWKIMASPQPFSQVTGIRQLCKREKFFICFKPGLCTLNSRNELLSSCRHKITNLLTKTNKKVTPGR